jgi:hypothetical protein
MVSTNPPVLAADLNAGLKRLKMAAMRRLTPELLGPLRAAGSVPLIDPDPATGVSMAASPGLGFSGTHRSAKKPVERSGRRGVAARKSSCRATAER